MSTDRPVTPPHHPTYNVHLSQLAIRAIVTHAFSGADLEEIQQLPSGKSFNNRIYFLTLKTNNETLPKTPYSGAVLKVSGHFFGPAKVQNEVSSLLLLEKYCPDIPVPKVLAWSEDGVKFRKIVRDTPQPISDQLSLTDNLEERHHGWILIGRLPGRALQVDDLKTHGETIMRQLASYVAQWRKMIGPTGGIGNLLLSINSDTSTSLDNFDSRVHGLLLAGESPPRDLLTCTEYYKYKLLDQAQILNKNEIVAPNRAIVSAQILDLLDNTLPHLSLFSKTTKADQQTEQHGPSPATFTHYDLSPRNILVTSNSSAEQILISGIIDFELSGFFPPEEEFTNSLITHKDDWPTSAWSIFSHELQRLGVEILEGERWEQACTLVEIGESIAPWYLREGGIQGQELERELQQARERVIQGVKKLKESTG